MNIVPDQVPVAAVDFLIIEATYGNRLNAPYDKVTRRHAEIVNRVVNRGARIIIPACEIVYHLKLLQIENAIPDIAVLLSLRTLKHSIGNPNNLIRIV